MLYECITDVSSFQMQYVVLRKYHDMLQSRSQEKGYNIASAAAAIVFSTMKFVNNNSNGQDALS